MHVFKTNNCKAANIKEIFKSSICNCYLKINKIIYTRWLSPGICCQSISVVQIKTVSCTENKLTLKPN